MVRFISLAAVVHQPELEHPAKASGDSESCKTVFVRERLSLFMLCLCVDELAQLDGEG